MDVWRLSSDQRKQLILSAVVEGYSEALDNMKESLRDYNKALESYQVHTCNPDIYFTVSE